MSCDNCRRTERNLAQAYARIEQLLEAERDLALAETALDDAELSVQERRADLRKLRIDINVWLEGQK